MRAVVVFESIYGNTQAIAEAVANGLRQRFGVCVAEVGRAPRSLVGVDLLVVGGPIRSHLEVGDPAGLPAAGAGESLRDYLLSLVPESGITAAAFSTARRTSWFPTGASTSPMVRRLEARGYDLLVKPEHFYVVDVQGPLEPGELERAQAWGMGLADAYMRVVHGDARRSNQ